MARMLREDSRLPAEGWSRWVRAMVPAEDPEEMVGQHFELRSADQEGVMCTNIRDALPDEMALCGIYEWRAERNDTQPMVVYVGSTCRGNPAEALRARVLEYCTDGSHKSATINKALRRGYELWVRVKTSRRSRTRAEDMENELLEKYDYAWNFRNNGERRQILN